MISVDIPGFGELTFTDVIFDYNGTLAVDGKLIPGVKEPLIELAEKLTIHVVTGDSSGTVKSEMRDIKCKITIAGRDNQGITKRSYLKENLQEQHTIAIGNGRNDEHIVKECRLGIIVLGEEGASVVSMQSADIVVPNIHSALQLLAVPKRLIATMRL